MSARARDFAYVCLIAILFHSCVTESKKKSSNKKYAVFFEWLESNGVKTSHISINQFPGMGKGLMAQSLIAKSDPIVSVPLRMVISTDSALDSRIGRVFDDETLELSQDDIVAFHLIYEASNQSSFWGPWLQLLPRTFDLPLLWSDSELRELQGSNLLHITESLLKDLTASYDRIMAVLEQDYGHIFDREVFSLDAYKWAHCVMYSRGLDVQFKADNKRLIVPFADFLNYSPHVETQPAIVESSFQFQLYSNTSFKPGDQIFASFARQSNLQLLQLYGFVLDDNPYDEVIMELRLNDQIQGVARRLELLKLRPPSSVASGGRRTGHSLRMDKPVSPDLMYAMRVSVMTPGEYGLVERALDNRPVSYRNEIEACDALYHALQSLHIKYRTSYQEDGFLLQAGLPPRQHMAVKLRRKEKQILQHAMNWIQNRKQEVIELGPSAIMENDED